MMRAMRAIVIGATGAVGSALVRELLASPRWDAVVTVGRRVSDPLAAAPGADKLSQRIVDFADLAALEQGVTDAARGASAAFCTLGVGQPRKVSKEELWKVDVEYATAFARGCRGAGVSHASILSSANANAGASTYYFKVKGSAENAVIAQAFARVSCFRPGLLVTQDMRYGLQDRITQAVVPKLSFIMPKRWHHIRVEDLGRAMRINAERPAAAAVERLQFPEFEQLLATAASK